MSGFTQFDAAAFILVAILCTLWLGARLEDIKELLERDTVDDIVQPPVPGEPTVVASPIVAPEPVQPTAPSPHPQVFHRVHNKNADGKWVPAEWVLRDSTAWQKAHDTTGQAIRDDSGNLILGKQ